MDDDIPPLLPPEDMPPVRSQADLHRFWRALMGPLGFGRRTLWLVFVATDGTVEPMVAPIDDIPEHPEEDLVGNLFWICAQVMDAELPPGTRVALLLSRPGSAQVSEGDRAWARALLAGARRAVVACEPVHLATDEGLVVIAPDDLAETA